MTLEQWKVFEAIIEDVFDEWFGLITCDDEEAFNYMIDPVLMALKESRKRSIAKLESDIAALQVRAGASVNSSAQRVYLEQVKLKTERKAKLLGELEALALEQPDLPLPMPPGARQAAPGAKK